MLRPIINEISPSTSILLRNKYIDIYRRAYFINKIYESGIKNIEIGSFRQDDNVLFGTRDVLYNVNRKVDTSSSVLVMEIENTLKNISCINSVHPYIEQIVYEVKDEKNIDDFVKLKIIAKQLGMTTKLNLASIKTDIVEYLEPDYVEVTQLTTELLRVTNPSKIFLRTNSFKEVDSALHKGVYNFSSSLLETKDIVNTIDLVTHIRKKLGFEVNINLEKLKETQREMVDQFNW